jgi:hypothetical protein
VITEVAITPVAFVRAIVAAYRRYGKDPSDALRRARIAPELLANPQSRVTGSQMQTLFGIAIQELDDEALGWFSRRLPWGSYGMLVPGCPRVANPGSGPETVVSLSRLADG